MKETLEALNPKTEEFFNDTGNCNFTVTQYRGPDNYFTVDELYVHFKTRLFHEIKEVLSKWEN